MALYYIFPVPGFCQNPGAGILDEEP